MFYNLPTGPVPNGRGAWRALGILGFILAFTAVAAPVQAYSLFGFGDDEGHIAADSPSPRALAYTIADQPAWLMPLLRRLAAHRGPGVTLNQFMLFRRGGQPSFLAIIWGGEFDDRMDLHRVEMVGGRPRLRFARTHTDHRLYIVEPSGLDVDGDGIAKLFVDGWSGGNALGNNQLKVFQLRRASIDVTPPPPVQPVAAGVVPSSGASVLIAVDDRWYNYFSSCSVCGPEFKSVFRWRDGRYRPSCRDEHKYYEERLRRLDDWLAENRSNPLRGRSRRVDWAADTTITIAIETVQAGRVEEGQRLLDEGIATLQREIDEGFWGDYEEVPAVREALDDARRDFARLISFARAHPESECPVQDYRGPTGDRGPKG